MWQLAGLFVLFLTVPLFRLSLDRLSKLVTARDGFFVLFPFRLSLDRLSKMVTVGWLTFLFLTVPLIKLLMDGLSKLVTAGWLFWFISNSVSVQAVPGRTECAYCSISNSASVQTVPGRVDKAGDGGVAGYGHHCGTLHSQGTVRGILSQLHQGKSQSLRTIDEGWRQTKRQRSSMLFGGQSLFNSLPCQLFCTSMILKKRMNSSFSSNHPGAIHPIFQIVQLQNS